MNYIDPKPFLHTIDSTDQLLQNDNTTFNEAGYSFNQAGWTFGGIYGADGKEPKLKSVSSKIPTLQDINNAVPFMEGI